jgi:hypothetical protein
VPADIDQAATNERNISDGKKFTELAYGIEQQNVLSKVLIPQEAALALKSKWTVA